MNPHETRSPQLFPVVIGAYDEHQALDVEPELAAVAALLAEFGADPVAWSVPMAERGGDAVDRRLRDWSRPDHPDDSVLYWLGHGWSDGLDVALAHARSPAAVRTSGLLPTQLAEAIRARQATGGEHWVMVVVDTCWSSRFVDKLNAELAAGVLGADRVLLVGVSGDGSTALGRFSTALRQCLTENFRADQRIEMWRLAAELDRRLPTGLVVGRRLGGAALTRRVSPLAGAVSLPLDLLRELETVLAALPTDERTHFVAKTRSAQESELSWFFEGRVDERAQVVRWLRTARSGLLIVTGRAGSGKSALLGHLLVHSLPDLRSVLIRSGLVDPLPEEEQPADGVFDAAIHLTGMTLDLLVRRIAEAASYAPPEPITEVADLLDRLIEHLQHGQRPMTLLIDALDEAVEPMVIARTVLRRFAAVPTVRIVVGTRASTREGLLRPEPDDDDLLDALTAVAPAGFAKLVWIAPDAEAVQRYVTRRLTMARDRGALSVDAREVASAQIAAAAQLIGRRDINFLYAHLAVNELLAEPRLLAGTQADLDRALPTDHRGLFARAAVRLTRGSAAFGPLLEALALSRGRGVPIVGGVWAAMASALSAGPVSDADVSAFLHAARPYVAVDSEGGQTVYRLAHQVFAEHFQGHGGGASRQRPISGALIDLTARAAVANPYAVTHLSGHVADAGAWRELAGVPAVLDRLDPLAVTADALRTVFGSAELALPVAGVIQARHRLARAAPADRAGLRQLAGATLGGYAFAEAATAARPWTIRHAHVERVSLYVALPGHDGHVPGLAFFDDPRVGRALASVGDDGTVRLWDPATALPIGAPMLGHRSRVNAVCPVPGPGGRVLLASGGVDGTVRLWDPATGTPVGPPLWGHDGSVAAVCAVPGGGGLLASAGGDGTVRLWDVSTSAPVGPPRAGHDGPVLDVCPVPAGDGRILVASAGADGTVRRWDPHAPGPVGAPLRGHVGVVTVVRPVPGPSGVLLASSGDDRTIRLWDPVTGAAAGPPLTGHTGGVEAIAAVTGLRGRELLASASADGTVRLWDTVAGAPVGVPLSSMAGVLWAVSAAASDDGRALLATAGEGGALRLWDLSAAVGEGQPPALTPGLVVAVSTAEHAGGRTDVVSMMMDGKVYRWDAATLLPSGFPATVEPGLVVMARVLNVGGRPLLVSAEHDGTVRRWWLDTLTPYGVPLRGHDGPVLALATVAGAGGAELVASGGGDGTVRLWDPTSDGPASVVLRGDSAAIRSLCRLVDANGRQLLAAGDANGTVRVWDPATGTTAGAPIGGHPAPVLALVSPRPGVLAVAGVDGSIRCWDLATRAAVGAPFTAHVSVIKSMCMVSGWLASGGADGRIRLSDAALFGTGVELPGHDGTVRDLCVVSRPGSTPLLASGGHDGTVRLWDPQARTPVGAPAGGRPESVDAVATVTGPGDRPVRVLIGEAGVARVWQPGMPGMRALDTGHVINVLAAGPAGAGTVLLGASDGWLAAVDVHDGAVAGIPVLAGDAAVTALCGLAPGTALVAVATADGRLSAWDLATGRLAHGPVAVHDGPIRAMRAAAGGRLLVTAGQDGTVQIMDVPAWTAAAPAMTGHAGWVWSVALRTDGSVAASAGADGTVRLWDVPSGGSLAAPLVAHTDQVRAVCFLGGSALASAGHDGTIRIWDVAAGRLHGTIPLGVPVHALDHTGAALTVGTGGGAVDLSLDASMLPR